jgi:hypothetical protein
MRARHAWIVAGTMLGLACPPGWAQSPSQAQRDAIRQSCAGDYPSVCASVPTGGREALQCLQQHLGELSPACQGAVGAVSQGGGGPAGANAGAPGRGAPPRPAVACRADFMALCQGVPPGGGRALMCLRRHAPELSPGCQEALAALRR